jgi:uncharacterized protein YbjT (DUF2867 family)
MSTVLLIGGTGSIGRLVVPELFTLGDTPRVLTRNTARARVVDGTEVVGGDLTDPASLAAVVRDVDAVVMTHGAPYGSGDYEAVDYGAVPALLEALDGREVRVALMSSIGVTGTGGSSRALLDWKRRGERLLRASGLPYTIVRPGWFDAGGGSQTRVELRQGDTTEYGPVRREHVAQTLAHAIHEPGAVGRTVEVFSTDGPSITDWDATFAVTDADQPGSLDGAHDRPGLPVDHEPDRIPTDLRRFQQRP